MSTTDEIVQCIEKIALLELAHTLLEQRLEKHDTALGCIKAHMEIQCSSCRVNWCAAIPLAAAVAYFTTDQQVRNESPDWAKRSIYYDSTGTANMEERGWHLNISRKQWYCHKCFSSLTAGLHKGAPPGEYHYWIPTLEEP